MLTNLLQQLARFRHIMKNHDITADNIITDNGYHGKAYPEFVAILVFEQAGAI